VEAVEQGGKKAAGVGAAAALGEPAESGIGTLLDQLEASIGELDRAVAEQVHARRLMTHPRVGLVAALTLTLTMGPVERFAVANSGKLPGPDSSQHSSGGRQQRSGTAHQQTRQSVSARLAGGSSAECGAAGAGDAPRLSTIGSMEVSCAGESGHGTEAGGEVVLDAALQVNYAQFDPGFAHRTARHILWSWLRPAS
jgi:hypothetical protein